MPALDNDAQEQRPAIISRSNALIFGGVLAVFLLIGSFFDLQVSQTLIDQSSSFGIFFAAFGEWPAAMGLVVAGTLLIAFRNRDSAAKRAGQIAGGTVLLLLGASFAIIAPWLYLTVNPIVIGLIGLALSAVVAWGILNFTKDADRRTVIRVALVLMSVVIIEMILINVIKVGWARPRMRMLVDTSGADFQSWWIIGNDSKAQLMQDGIKGEEFKSFPSGHAANGATMLLLTILIPLKDSMRRHANLLFWLGAAWAALVALSRIIVGAHFVSDTVVGITVTFVVMLLAYRIALPKFKTTSNKELKAATDA